MIEVQADLWKEAEAHQAVVVITTNGSVRTDGCGVMGRGCALEARGRFDGIDKRLGEVIRTQGNHVALLWDAGPVIYSFPVKHMWHQRADVRLIEQSARELADMANRMGFERVVMPRPGCGNGRLRWPDVKPLLEPFLDDRFVVVTK
jgi:hypothetical protein